MNCIIEKLQRIESYLRNRFIDKTHLLTSKLTRGDYHELDTRILYCLFDSLVLFVEQDLASLYHILSAEKICLSKCRPLRLFGFYSNRSAGLAYLESEVDSDWGDKAREIKRLYMWWTLERPLRVVPDSTEDLPWEEVARIEALHEKEDTEMLISLIKIRNYL